MTAVLIASPLDGELATRIAREDERIELLYDPAVVPASRYMGDIAGDFAPDPARWAELLGRAEILFGIPGSSPHRLVEAVRGGPALRWVQARNAGAGQQVAQALELDRPAIERVAVTTASGVHAGPLAEFTLMGLLVFAKRLPRMQRDKAQRFWPPQEQPSGELRGQTLLVVGAGAIGAEIARLAKAGKAGANEAHGHGLAHNSQADEPDAVAHDGRASAVGNRRSIKLWRVAAANFVGA